MRRILFLLLAATLLSVAAVPASAGGASVDRLYGPFETGVFTVVDDDTGTYVLNFAMCDWVQRVERPDGSAVETQQCHLGDTYLIWDWDLFDWAPCPECGPPEKAFVDGPVDMECGWVSDYWLNTTPSDVVFAERLRSTVTPSGNVSITTEYPAEPQVCEP